MTTTRFLVVPIFLSFLFGAAILAQEKNRHPEVSREKLYITCKCNVEGNERVTQMQLDLLTPDLPAQPGQRVALPSPFPSIRVLRYLPWAELKQTLADDPRPDAGPAMILSIEGPKLAYRRGLMAGEPARSRMVSLIGAWRHLAAADQKQRDRLFKEFENELQRAPRVMVSRPDGKGHVEVLPVEVGKTHTLDKMGCKIRIIMFYPTFSAAEKGPAKKGPATKRLNPAVKLEVEWDGKKEEWVVFSRFPDFNKKGHKKAPDRIRLDCPLDQRERAPAFAIVTTGRFENEVWMRFAGKTTARPLRSGERVSIPGSKYAFRLAEFSPAGRILDDYELTRAKRAATVLQIEWMDLKERTSRAWLKFGMPRTIVTKHGPVHVKFGRKKSAAKNASHGAGGR